MPTFTPPPNTPPNPPRDWSAILTVKDLDNQEKQWQEGGVDCGPAIRQYHQTIRELHAEIKSWEKA